ncbi:MAG: KpsF/GutQ family sugar-phosphate isomerase [Magnetococcales bacterium]|nr:KpsF/GutQ family sugar-phosphate isomerase [Magnetococcales bacterium]
MLEKARNTLALEADAIRQVAERLDSRFIEAVTLIFGCRGRVVVTGMGKSGIIARKIAATLASTGTPAFFLHPAEGSHGDLGMVTSDDVLLALSNSGETEEVNAILPVIRRLGASVISLTGNQESTLARNSDAALDVSVEKEACPLNLAPTCSTTAALAMGDALAVALLEKRQFREDQFALFHPGGSLGRRLLLSIKDLMHSGEKIPTVEITDKMRDVVLEMSAKRFGMTAVLDKENTLVGIITDGDLRRHLQRNKKLMSRSAVEVMTENPHTIQITALAAEAAHLMQDAKISSLFVMEEQALVGVIHFHDLLQAGIV